MHAYDNHMVAGWLQLTGVCPITHSAYLFLWIPAKVGDTDHPSPVKIDHLKPELIP